LARVNLEPSLRVMVFCAGDNHGRQDIAFPHQSEIKVNGGEVKANLRGLKNKPGSTRPVDITKELRLKIPQYTNNVEMTYALTSKVDGGSLYVSCLHPHISLPLHPIAYIPWRHSWMYIMLTFV
jgi:E3 SUMO-protein ligase PIAS1